MGDAPPNLLVPVTPRRDQPPPSAADLASVRDILKDDEPLAGRRVMVPVTQQAFMQGHLQPPTKEDDAATGTRPSEERVLANLGEGYLAEMSREEAADLIKRRINAATPPSSTSTKSTNNGSNEKKSSLKQSAQRATNNKQQRKQQQKQPVAAPSVLPFFEIREEFDAEGRQVKAEAVNVAQEMKALKDALRSQKGSTSDGGNEAKGTKEIHELIENMDIGGDDEQRGEVSGAANSEAQDSADELHQQHEPVSDEKYNSLSSRLDELARLEEEAERKKSEGKSSRQHLQGKAWGKGFLSGGEEGSSKSSTGSSKKKASSPEKKKNKKNASVGWGKGFLNAESKAKKKSHAKGEKIPASDEPERQRKVVFGEDEVKEIPRIGQNSIKAALQNTAVAPAVQEGIPFGEDMFSGVVKERPPNMSVVNVQRPMQVSPPSQAQQQQQQPKKKLSRFAQQRLEQRGEL